MPAKLSRKEYLRRARETHGTKYSYKEANLEETLIKIWCKACKEFFYQRKHAHIYGRGCKACGNASQSAKLSSTTAVFVKKAEKIHGNAFDYAKVQYAGTPNKVSITCRTCNTEFQQTPNRHLAGCGCLVCENISRTKTTATFVAEAKAVHGDLYDYTHTVYVNKRTMVTIGCIACGNEFQRKTFSHLRGAGCSNTKCQNYIRSGYSRKAIKWLNYEAKKRRIKIEHAENAGEFRIPGTRWRVDGYHRKSNTVFEFHGDRYHGNPNIFAKSRKCNPFSIKTAGQLYKETLAREKKLRALGYNLIVMWEQDWNKMAIP